MNLHDTNPTKPRIIVLTDEGHYGSDTWAIGDIENLDIRFEDFNFDDRSDWITADEVQDEVGRLDELIAMFPNESSLAEMRSLRQTWLDEETRNRAEEEAATQADNTDRLEAARAILRAAGELP